MKPAQPINQPPAAGFRRVTAGRRAHSRCAGGQRGETHFAGVFRGGDSAPAAARRLLARLLGVVQDCRAAAAKGAAPDVLHDLRVGLRRFRTALRFLAPHLPPSAARIHRSLAELSAALSPLRDEEIWNAFLCRPEVSRLLRAGRARRVRDAGRRRARTRPNALHRTLRKPFCVRRFRLMARFVRAGMQPAAGRRPSAPSYEAFAAKRLRRAYSRILSAKPLSRHAPPAEVHALRKRVRRARYGAEFAAPALGRPVRNLAANLKALADALGDWHDADVFRTHLQALPPATAATLEPLIGRGQRRAFRDYQRAWKRLSAEHYRRKTLRRLERTVKRRKRK